MRALLLLLLVGCTEAPDERVTVKLTLVRNTQEVAALCGTSPLEPYGCAKRHGKDCEIVALKPSGFDDHRKVETLGHELLHCFWGPTHI